MQSGAAIWTGMLLAAVIVVSAAAAPENQAATDEAFSRAASAVVDRVEREDGFSGVILVARGDHVLLRQAAGYSDRERGIRNTPDTKFTIESVTKQFTATAIMMLVQEGKVSLDDPISKYYAASPPAWKDVTIKHLLTHSSGIEDYWVHRHADYYDSDASKLLKSTGDIFRIVQNDPLGFRPGMGFSYSNAGYALLAEVIRKVSGASYEDFLASRIFQPLGMRNSGFGLPPGGAMKGYVRTYPEGVWRPGAPDVLEHVDIAAGAGGIYSTVDDMLIWSLAQGTNELLSEAARSAMFRDYGYNYGFGIRFAPKFGRELIWHTGNDAGAGFAAIFDRFPEDALTVVAMTNNTGITGSTATLLIEGKVQTFPANATRKAVEEVERLYFGREP
ncbi:MAG TPA: serine hydrolase domain-containing protein [Micropepsaceae bacterium]|nr:serine hydrolase domain-containing protein [Micropepsaceae bacterium]